ncbi:hypothetical protein CsSME_00001716 [Camellia sinensis var. sinensis]
MKGVNLNSTKSCINLEVASSSLVLGTFSSLVVRFVLVWLQRGTIIP